MATLIEATAGRAPGAYRALVQVARTRRVTPHMVRVTFTGPGLRDFPGGPPDQWIRLFLPRPWQDRPLLPLRDRWWPELRAMPDDARPVLRNYTVRSLRPLACELDVDVVVHGQGGPGSAWALRATPGDWAGVLAQPGTYRPPADARWQLLAGDESALPAIAAILESLVTGAPARVFLEVPGAEDRQELATRGDVRVTWLPRTDGRGRLLRAVREAQLPGGPPYVWVAGETGTVAALRRHLIAERGIDQGSVCFCGYWRRPRVGA